MTILIGTLIAVVLVIEVASWSWRDHKPLIFEDHRGPSVLQFLAVVIPLVIIISSAVFFVILKIVEGI